MPGYQKSQPQKYLFFRPSSDLLVRGGVGLDSFIGWRDIQTNFGLNLSSVATYKTSTCVGMDLISDLSSDGSR